MNEKLLTVAMATYDDFDGVFFTIQALRMYNDICKTRQVEYIVLDGNADSSHGKTVKSFVDSLNHHQDAKYIKN